MRITVTEVRLSPDLRHATAFVARLGRSDVDALLPALSAGGALPARRARPLRCGCACVPDLSFQPDTALDYAMHIDALLRRPDVAKDLGSTAEGPDAEG